MCYRNGKLGHGTVTVLVQGGWTDGRTDNRPVPSLHRASSEPTVPSTDGREDGRPVHRRTGGRTGVGYETQFRAISCSWPVLGSDPLIELGPGVAKRAFASVSWRGRIYTRLNRLCKQHLRTAEITTHTAPCLLHVKLNEPRNDQGAQLTDLGPEKWPASFGAVRQPGRTVTIPTTAVIRHSFILGYALVYTAR
ncbi:hypothetical protein B0H19DRAFT_1074100 [Mycena capillaripes]|nr:hypothetical protein B0H19DRAFT_1074100 [Mycena capillaripes]